MPSTRASFYYNIVVELFADLGREEAGAHRRRHFGQNSTQRYAKGDKGEERRFEATI